MKRHISKWILLLGLGSFWAMACTKANADADASADLETDAGDQVCTGDFEPEHGTRSVLYPEDWKPGDKFTVSGYSEKLFIQDYSYAGYKNSEVTLPLGHFKEFITVDNSGAGITDGTADAAPLIQAAVEQAAQTSGGAIVYIPPGLYRLESQIHFSASGVVIRGAGSDGPDATRLWFYEGGGLGGLLNPPDKYCLEQANINVGPPSDNGWNTTCNPWTASLEDLDVQSNDEWLLANDGHIFDQYVEVQDATGISAGDDIQIAWGITSAFMEELNAGDYWGGASSPAAFFLRTVQKVEGNKIYFKVPLRYDALTRDNARVLRVEGYFSENGIEHLAISTAKSSTAAVLDMSDQRSEEVGMIAIQFRYCKDCWIRDVRSFSRPDAATNPDNSWPGHELDYHLWSHGLVIYDSFRVTVDDVHLQKPQARIAKGGNGYLFYLGRSNEVLVKDSTAKDGRHNFQINRGFGSAGNVFLRVRSEGGRLAGVAADAWGDWEADGAKYHIGPSDTHDKLAIAHLWDQCTIVDALAFGNRGGASASPDGSSAGHTATQFVVWNVDGTYDYEGDIDPDPSKTTMGDEDEEPPPGSTWTESGERIYSYNSRMGYVIGAGPDITVVTDMTDGDTSISLAHSLNDGTEPEDFFEDIDPAELAPKSLFEEQLARRLNCAVSSP